MIKIISYLYNNVSRFSERRKEESVIERISKKIPNLSEQKELHFNLQEMILYTKSSLHFEVRIRPYFLTKSRQYRTFKKCVEEAAQTI